MSFTDDELEVLCCLPKHPIMVSVGDIAADTGISINQVIRATRKIHQSFILVRKVNLVGIHAAYWKAAQQCGQKYWSKTYGR